MRLSDLMGCDVVDVNGGRVGRVSDVHIVQDGSIVDGVQARFRVDAVLVGRGGWGERVGYVRGRARGPWLLNVVFRWIERHAQLIDANEISDWDLDSHTLRLRTVNTPRAIDH